MCDSHACMIYSGLWGPLRSHSHLPVLVLRYIISLKEWLPFRLLVWSLFQGVSGVMVYSDSKRRACFL